MAHFSLTWKAFEHAEKQRTPDWYWSVGVVGGALALTSILFDNVLFGVFIILGTATLLLQTLRKPRHIEFEVFHKGVRIADKLHLYATLESFWVTSTPEPRLLIKSKKRLAPLLVLPLASEVDIELLEDTLLEFIDEEELHLPVSQIAMEYLGF